MMGPLPSVIALQVTPSDIELLLLRSIEWMTFENGTYDQYCTGISHCHFAVLP
ncbi:hypothetical protein F4604DRAFT_1748863, partial [Suillus subluteus]